MPTLTLLLIRHGETADNLTKTLQGWRNTPLTPPGHADAQTLASKLSPSTHHIRAVYHSPLLRITQTLAPILAAHPDLTRVIPDEALRGQGLGTLEGQNYSAVDMGNPRSADDKPGVERFDTFALRLKASLSRILAAEIPLLLSSGDGNRTVLIATHGVSITTIFKTLESTPHCEGFNPVLAERGPEAFEVRYPDSEDVAKMVVKRVEELPLSDGEVEWEKVVGKPFVIEWWGKKESAVG